MRTIYIDERKICEALGRKNLTHYMERVIDFGHRPGVLSGSELKGEVKKYAGSYARTREKIAQVLSSTYMIHPGYSWVDTRAGKRRVKCWIHHGEPVELTLR